jgi:hypothetical protein
MFPASQSRSRVITCRGARAAERCLLEQLATVQATEPEDLSLPVRVVVPSKSLRRHLLRTLARRQGAAAGLQVQTLFGLALEVVQRAGLEVPRADAAFEVQVRRLAAVEPALRVGLDELADGYDAVVGAVRDLLDAGFLPGNEEGVLDRLDELAGAVAPERVERARALVRLAAAAFVEAESGGLRHSMRALQVAEELLPARGPDLVPTRALFVHGFADVTGVAADLLVGLLRVLGGTVVLDRPPDPADPTQDDLGGAYLSRLEERVAHLEQEADGVCDPPPEFELAEAPDVESEARWVAERIRGLLDEGAEPEGIGVVGRSLEAIALPLRRHLRRLGVPFSAEGAAVPGAGPRRKLSRLTELLGRGTASEVDLWIEARAGSLGTTELLLGLRVLGIPRLADLAVLPADAAPSAGVPLPIALAPEEDEAETMDDWEPRRLSSDRLRRAVAEARQLVDALERQIGAGPATLHRRLTVQVLAALGWDDGSEESRAVHEALDGLCREFPESFELTGPEWLKLLRDRLGQVGEVPLGGGGAGVQVLTVMEARARTFDRLFAVAANRGAFPRIVHEDPMLPESVRARLAADVLPEMPVKRRSADEERYLWAQLLSSAPAVAVSWHVYGAEGTRTPSPFVDRLRRCEGVDGPVPVPQLWYADGIVERPRTVYELAVLEASTAGTRGIVSILEAAVAEGRTDSGAEAVSVAAGVVAQARADILAAVERPKDATATSPWFGFTGVGGASEDEVLWVTLAERTGTCPLQAFIERRLGVLPLPDPLLGLPGIGGALVGQVVHGVLESVVREAVDSRGELEVVLHSGPTEVRWPDRARLDTLVLDEARRVAATAGLAPWGLAPLLAARARQFLEVERGLEWAEGSLRDVLGTEVEGWAAVPGVSARLRFRADRVDAEGPTAVLVDYKTAKPEVEAKTEPSRSDNLRDRIARGRLLQAAAYSQAMGAHDARGRYLYLKPNDAWVDLVRELSVDRDDDRFIEPFADAVRCIVAARKQGVAFPRLEEANGRQAAHCGYCGVAEACRRDDSTFRRDLVRWMRSDAGAGDPSVDAARELWWLGFAREVKLG